MKKGKWTFLTNHGKVLTYISKHPQSITEEIAREVGVTLRTVQKIVDDLQVDGYITRHKEGRCNRYTIHPERPMRHQSVREYAVGDVLFALGYSSNKEKQSES